MVTDQREEVGLPLTGLSPLKEVTRISRVVDLVTDRVSSATLLNEWDKEIFRRHLCTHGSLLVLWVCND